MSLPCPYRHVSYATWRLDVIRSLCQSLDEPHLRPSALPRRGYQKPSVPNASTSRSATKRGDSATERNGPTPAIPPATESGKKDTEPGGTFSPYSEPGRQAIKQLLSDLKKASKKIQLGKENVESYPFGLHKSLILDPPGDADTQDSPSLRLSTDVPLRKYHSTQGESPDANSVEGQQIIEDLLSGLQEISKNVHRRVENSAGSHLPERETPPTLESPIVAQVADAARRREERKEHPSYRRIKGLKNNPWAEVIASPLRACQGSGARLPSDLLLDFGYVKNQKDGKIYLMPAELADLDAFEARLAAELATSEARPRILEGGTGVKGDNQSAIKDGATEGVGAEDGSPSSSTEAPQKTTDHLAPTRRYIPVQSRLLSNITFLRLVTDKTTQPAKKPSKFPSPTTLETISGEVGKLVHFDARESTSTAQHYLQNKYRFHSTIGDQDAARKDPTGSGAPSTVQAKARFNLNRLQWQPDIYLRIAEIMRNRIFIAMKLLAHAESAARSQALPVRPSGVIALPTPQDGIFKGEELRRLMRGTSSVTASAGSRIRAVASERKESPSPNGDSSSTLDADPPVPTQISPLMAQEPEYHVLGHSEWLPGSIFLHVGNEDVATPISSASSSSSLPPLPSNNPLIPPMITVLDRYRFPVFSINHLFTNISVPGTFDLEELENLIRQESILQHPNKTSSSRGGPGGYLLLIRPIPGPPKAVIEETWRLWRYLGGKNMDISFASGTD
ncbi:uncharacterized protein PV07_06525 [Cladophialophora immunda]|uniref:Uncharacterized protein n=1 Tax=Cladophialophora immunda TaxID=569365 RepID=A0A0D2CSX5_9EURO|nr:uncharacterized protein PV07_06525 [Cladophialophora immunda]KIW26714.1 hypothetical protein PV07_06525 [Cladophialophora immunda]